ncbi:hypothetical protein HY969_04725 [Candidatus Kaiserbacteria bacterium]|nr:hypothetical protein [Candidatus Kaiserbacteria bacterium]
MKNIKTSYIIIAVIVLFVGGIGFTKYLQGSDPNVVSRSAFHWHPTLTIYAKGEKQTIPPNIGIGAVHQPMHTHSEDSAAGVIHLEFGGAANREDVMLGKFFKNWGKDMRSFGMNMRMTVNGKENTEFENYVMHDKDVIELHYD